MENSIAARVVARVQDMAETASADAAVVALEAAGKIALALAKTGRHPAECSMMASSLVSACAATLVEKGNPPGFVLAELRRLPGLISEAVARGDVR